MEENANLDDVLGPEPPEPPPAGPPAIVLRTAAALLGASSGGVLGLLVATLLGGVWPSPQGMPVPVTASLAVFLAIAMALVNLRQPSPAQPIVPRAAWAVVLNSLALLLTLGVFLFQSAYLQGLNAAGQRAELPLPIWPASRAALIVALALIVLGVVSMLIGWIEVATRRGYTGAKWLAQALLIGGAWAGLGLVCYITGYGLRFS
jgi:hypothetical protein